MKNLLMVVLVVSVFGVVAVGCAQANVYSLDMGPLGCYEVTTSDPDIQTVLTKATFKESPCDTSNSVGSCTTDHAVYGTQTQYFSKLFYTAAEAEAACTTSGGKWKKI